MKKKILIFITVFMIFPSLVLANEKKTVKFSKCVDGDTALFIMDKEEVKVRFLAIDTPETKHPKKGTEPFGKEASNYTCNKLKNGKKIVLEFDKNSDKKDSYNRYLAWVFVDDKLIEKELVRKGYAEVKYLYADYTYTDILKEAEKKAKSEKIGIWSEKNEFNLEEYILGLNIWIKILLTIIVVVVIFLYLKHDKKARKKLLKKTETEFDKQLKKYVNKKLK